MKEETQTIVSAVILAVAFMSVAALTHIDRARVLAIVNQVNDRIAALEESNTKEREVAKTKLAEYINATEKTDEALSQRIDNATMIRKSIDNNLLHRMGIQEGRKWYR